MASLCANGRPVERCAGMAPMWEPSGEIGVGVGVGANILFGGNARAYALQPVSLSGEAALNVSVGISTIELRWVP